MNFLDYNDWKILCYKIFSRNYNCDDVLKIYHNVESSSSEESGSSEDDDEDSDDSYIYEIETVIGKFSYEFFRICDKILR